MARICFVETAKLSSKVAVLVCIPTSVHEKGLPINLMSSGEACEAAVQTQKPRVTTAKDGLNWKVALAGSHVLGWYFSLTRVNLYLNRTYYLFASMVTCLWNVKVKSLFLKALGTTTSPELRPQPPVVTVIMLIVECELSFTHLWERTRCLYDFTFYPIPACPWPLLSPPP